LATTYTQSLRLAEPTPGDPAVRNAWGTILNENQVLLEAAILDTAVVNIAGLATYTLTTANGAADQARPYIQSYQGALTAGCTVTLPNVPKIGWAQNATTGGFSVVLTTGVGSTVTVPPDSTFYWFMVDGSGNVTLPSFTYGALAATSMTVNGSLTINGVGVALNFSPGNFRFYNVQSSGLDRWGVGADADAETGSNAGSNFNIVRYNDTGTVIDEPVVIVRETGLVQIGDGLLVTGGLTTDTLTISGGAPPPGVQFGDMKHSALGIEGGGWRLCAAQERPVTDPFWVFMIANGLTGSWEPGFGGSTYNMPDARGKVLAALDNLGGTAAGNLTEAVAGINSEGLLASGGNQSLQSHEHGIADPTHTHVIDDPQHSHSIPDPGHAHTYVINQTGGGSSGYQNNNSGPTTQSTGNSTTGITGTNDSPTFVTNQDAATGITVDSTGAGTSQNVQPTIMTAVLMYVGA
jgi:hypothetical protein